MDSNLKDLARDELESGNLRGAELQVLIEIAENLQKIAKGVESTDRRLLALERALLQIRGRM